MYTITITLLLQNLFRPTAHPSSYKIHDDADLEKADNILSTSAMYSLPSNRNVT